MAQGPAKTSNNLTHERAHFRYYETLTNDSNLAETTTYTDLPTVSWPTNVYVPTWATTAYVKITINPVFQVTAAESWHVRPVFGTQNGHPIKALDPNEAVLLYKTHVIVDDFTCTSERGTNVTVKAQARIDTNRAGTSALRIGSDSDAANTIGSGYVFVEVDFV